MFEPIFMRVGTQSLESRRLAPRLDYSPPRLRWYFSEKRPSKSEGIQQSDSLEKCEVQQTLEHAFSAIATCKASFLPMGMEVAEQHSENWRMCSYGAPCMLF